MAPDVGELVAALPEDLDEERGSAQQGLQDLLMRLSHKPVPVGSSKPVGGAVSRWRNFCSAMSSVGCGR